MSKFRVIVLSVAFLVVISLSALIVFSHVRSNKRSVAFAKVQVGDTKQRVAQLFGSTPEEVSKCYDPDDQFNGKCAEVYWYFAFLERWEILFDRDGKVIDKGYNVSF
jgi:hypothetical protein